MEETEKKKKGRPRKQAAVTENNQETSPKEGEAKFEPQALDSENAQKNHGRRAPKEKQKIPAPEESAQETSPEHSASDNSALGADKKKSGTGKTAAPARGKAAKRGRKTDTVQAVKEVPPAITSQERKAIASAAQDRKALWRAIQKNCLMMNPPEIFPRNKA